MPTRTPTRQAVEVPDLVGVRADHAIQRLRELGLLPNTWGAEVDDVNEAGIVLGLEPPAGSPVGPTALITLSVAPHPDFRGHPDDPLPRQAYTPVEPALTEPDVRDCLANSRAERHDDAAQPQERGVLQMELW